MDTLTTPERNRLARIKSIDEQIADLTSKRAALVNPPFKAGDRVTVNGEDATVWTVSGHSPIDPRLVTMHTGSRDRYNAPAGKLRKVN
jgi:hypothetical protein